MAAEDSIAPNRDQEVITDEPKGTILTAESAVKAVKAGDRDVDIAAQIIADYTEENGDRTWTSQEEKKLMRKVDWWLIPIVCFLVPDRLILYMRLIFDSSCSSVPLLVVWTRLLSQQLLSTTSNRICT